MSAKAILSASVSAVPVYVEDVFSTFLYTGNGSTQTITNGIDLAGEGGLVWLKNRGLNPSNNFLFDTLRGAGNYLRSNQNSGEGNLSPLFSSFNANGFSLNGASSDLNSSSYTYASWTFRKQPKFFDVVTWAGDSTSGRQITHNLESTPGMVVIKSLVTDQWAVWHRSLTPGYYIVLNSNAAQTTAGAVNRFGNGSTTVDPVSAYFTVGSNGEVNQTGNNYVAYLFAHDAGGFGTAGTGNVISCGTFTTDGTGLFDVNLGWEPQWLLAKESGGSGGQWYMADTMRGFGVTEFNTLKANSSDAESVGSVESFCTPYASGFRNTSSFFGPNATMIYIAIRRGPMKTPTVGTQVFAPILQSNVNTPPRTISGAGFAPDLMLQGRTQYANGASAYDRLRGQVTLLPPYTDAESSAVSNGASFTMDGISYTGTGGINNNGNAVDWFFRRAPGFFDVVAFTGAGAGSFNHNLGVVPELIIVKQRATGGNSWGVYSAATGNTHWLALQATQAAVSDSTMWNNTTPTNTVFSIGSTSRFSGTCIAYLFATLAGVSKVGNYTGTGTTLQINCGFTAGARFVLIKRTDSTGDWYVWDTARGIISGNDPYLRFNSTGTEVTGTDYIDPLSSGFEIDPTAPAAINANGGTYIFLAIA